MRWLAIGFLTVALLGCAAAQVRESAALALECPELNVSVVEKKPGTWIANGCEKSTLCSYSGKAGAAPSCVAGMPQSDKLK
jgi:hypothetical protein